MAKYNYTIELTIKYATELTVSEIDSDTKKRLEESEDFDSDAYNVIWDADDIMSEIIMNIDQFYNADTFLLEVKDKEDNVVYSTKDQNSLRIYPYYDEDKEEDIDAPNFTFSPFPKGDYLAENKTLKWCTVTTELETDEPFDITKLSLYPSSVFDDYLCEDDVHLNKLAYDGHLILGTGWDYYDSYCRDYNIVSTNGEYFNKYRVKGMYEF